MAVSFHNGSITCPMISEPISDFLQCQASWDRRDVKVLPGSKLVQDSSGSVSIIPKTPFEVLGERFIGPLVAKITTLTSGVFSYFQSPPSRLSSDPVEIRPRSEVPPSQQQRLFCCLQSDPDTDDLDDINRVFSARFAGKKLEDREYSSEFMSVITCLQKEYDLNPLHKFFLVEIYSQKLPKCLLSIQNN